MELFFFLTVFDFICLSISAYQVDERKTDAFWDAVSHYYLSFDFSQTYLDKLVNESLEINPDILVKVAIEGITFEKRPIKSYTFQHKGKNNNPIILIDAGTHAREWHSQSMAFYFMRQLATESKNKGLISNFTFVIIPTVNPDGYEFGFKNFNFKSWRKTRVPLKNGCYGVDINRNYDIKWNTGEKSAVKECSEIYKGTHPFSEPETKAIGKVMNRVKSRALMYISIHTYGNKILYPWGFTLEPHPNKTALDIVGNAGKKAAWEKFQIDFDVSQSSSGLYVAAGGSDDYAMSIGIPFAFTLELGKEKDNFAAPVQSLPDILESGWEVIIAMIKKASEFVEQ